MFELCKRELMTTEQKNTIRFTKLHELAKLPIRHYKTDAGMDISSIE